MGKKTRKMPIISLPPKFSATIEERTGGNIVYFGKFNRRKILLATVTYSRPFFVRKNAKAGIFGGISEEEYQNETTALADLAKEVSSLPKDSEGKEQKVDA